jgi:hypothetical protein
VLATLRAHATGFREEWPRMLNLQNFQLLHRHGDDNAVPMTEHTADSLDPERDLLRGQLRGARIFRCEACSDEVVVVPAASFGGEDAAAG